jgi:hypothetical protein
VSKETAVRIKFEVNWNCCCPKTAQTERLQPHKKVKGKKEKWSDGMSDIEGKAARVAASECWQRASFNYEGRPVTSQRVEDVFGDEFGAVAA